MEEARPYPRRIARLAVPPRRAVRMGAERPRPAADLGSGKGFSTAFWLVVAGYVGYAIYLAFQGNAVGAMAGTIVVGVSFLPSLLWVMGMAKGMPIYPLYAATFSYTFGSQMMTNKKLIEAMDPGLFFLTCASVCGFLLVGTAAWMPFVSRGQTPPRSTVAIGGSRAQPTLILCLFISTVYIVAVAAGWLYFLGVFNTIVRAFMFCLGSLSTFILCSDLGRGRLNPRQRTTLFILLGVSLAAHASSLMLVIAMSQALLGFGGYIVGSRRIPWRALVVFLVAAAVLHYGKYSLRERYWGAGVAGEINWEAVKPWDYPKLYAEWVASGLSYVTTPDKFRVDEHTSLMDRSGLLHLFVMAQEASDTRGFLGGRTYEVLPAMLVPRVLSENKVASHETTYLLNIFYGLQSREDTANTTIGWGMFNEAYANFGYLGTLIVGGILGAFFGWATRYSMAYPIHSYRGLFGISVLNLAFQSEYSSGVFVTVLFQSVVVLMVLRFAIMQRVKVDTERIEQPVRIFREMVRRLGRGVHSAGEPSAA